MTNRNVQPFPEQRSMDDERVTALTRAPGPQLQPWVERLWAQRSLLVVPAALEHVLPTGAMHLVIRLAAPPLFVLHGREGGQSLGHAVVGGARSRFYCRRLDPVTDSVGALLRPGAAQALFGVPADELTGAHVDLDALWGQQAQILRERLLEQSSLGRRLDLFQCVLMARLSGPPPDLHPLVAGALRDVRPGVRIGDVVARSGSSHRHFNACFRAFVGLSPKAYARVLRFRHLLHAVRSSAPAVGWAELAADCGYADQAHLVREFREMAGVTPGTYRRLAPAQAHHLAR